MSRWVFLRGLMREARHWGNFPQAFASQLADAQVVTPDFPGNGSLHSQRSVAQVGQMVEFLRDELRRQNLTPPYHVLALSLGAMVAVAWSQRYPHEVAKLVLINTSLSPYNPFYQRLRQANYPALLGGMLFGSVAQREELILRLTSNLAAHAARRQDILQQWFSYARQYPVSRANVLRQLHAAICYRAAVHAPVMPVLLLAARQDRLVSVACSITLFEKWQCAIRIHPAAGHDLPLDDAAWVIAQIRDWL